MDNIVKLASVGMWWHLHREVNGKHYLAHIDNRIGSSVKLLTPDKFEIDERPFKQVRSYTDPNGKEMSYTDEPYKEHQIESFSKLTEQELDEWVQRGY